MAKDSVTDTNTPSSPVCYAGEGSAAYNGMAEDAEIVAVLEALQQAERAGTAGHAVIVRKLEVLIPRVQDAQLRTQLAARLRVLADSIGTAEERLAARSKT